MNVRFFMSGLVVPVVMVLLGGCAGPVDENATDYAEFESVWQYLKVYSIYQDRIPDDPFAFSDPEDIMLAVNDTLYGNNYTCFAGYSDITITPATNISPLTTKQTDEVVRFDSLTDSTAVIKISSFIYGVTFNEFRALLPLVQRFPNLIIDLRSNGGGEIVEVDSIIADFLPNHTPYIQARERRYDKNTRTAFWVDWRPLRSDSGKVARRELRNKKVVILADSESASASEILIAALKDGDNVGATLVGTRSYGKGIGQVRLLRERRGRPILQITFLQLKGLEGGSIGEYHHKGIEPDIPASGSDEEWVLTAVRVHEPGVTSLPPLRKRTARMAAYEPAGYRVIYEE